MSHYTYVCLFDLLDEKCRGFYTLTPGSEKGKWIRRSFSIFVGTLLSVGWVLQNPNHRLSCLSSPHSTAMMWLSLTLELMYIGLLLISCTLLSVQLCIRTCCPSTQRWGQLLNAFAAIFTVLGGRYLNQTSVAFVFPSKLLSQFDMFTSFVVAGLLGMVGHMMFMQVFQTTVSMGPEDFKPHSYGYSWAF